MAAHAQQLEQEEVTVETILPGTKKVYLADMAANHNVDGRLYILNTDDLKFLGIVSTGFDGMIYVPHRRSEIYVATTYYSKLTSGERLELLEVHDNSSLELKEEIEIPKRRAQAGNYRPLMQGSADDRFVFIQNATPATSITVVDMDAKATTAEISNDGCYGTYPATGNPLRFSTICGDGTFGTYTLAQEGKSAEGKASTKLFDADEDALFSHAERDGQSWLFVSYGGTVPGLAGINKLLLHPDGRLFLANVPGIENSGLSDSQIAQLLNWALDNWGDRSISEIGPPLTGDEIRRLEMIPVDDLTRLRGRIADDLAVQGIDIGSCSTQ